jgi:hypothetical protein
MNIYFSHSKNFDYLNQFYLPIKNFPLSKKHRLIFPHQNSQKSYPIKKSLPKGKIDLIIAEISHPSTGQGIELGWANLYKVPIICIHKTSAKISNSVKLLTKNIIPYKKLETILPQLIKK